MNFMMAGINKAVCIPLRSQIATLKESFHLIFHFGTSRFKEANLMP